MIPAEIIARKRDGLPLTDSSIAEFVAGYTRGDIADYQMAALAMAIFLRGMDLRETVALTQAMLASGEVVVMDLAMCRKSTNIRPVAWVTKSP